MTKAEESAKAPKIAELISAKTTFAILRTGNASAFQTALENAVVEEMVVGEPALTTAQWGLCQVCAAWRGRVCSASPMMIAAAKNTAPKSGNV